MTSRDERADAPQVRARPALVSPARCMSGSPGIAVMQRELGRQLAALRRQARLTQQQLAARAGFSRSTVSVAEIGRQAHAREFWAACDKALGTGRVLTGGFAQIEAVRGTQQRAAARAAQEVREAQALAALAEARQRGRIETTVTAVQACPRCGQDVIVLTTLIPSPAGPAAPPAGR